MAASNVPPKPNTPVQTMRFLEQTRIPEDLADLSDKSSYLRQVIDYCEQTYVTAPNKLETIEQSRAYLEDAMGVISESVLQNAQNLMELLDAQTAVLDKLLVTTHGMANEIRNIRHGGPPTNAWTSGYMGEPVEDRVEESTPVRRATAKEMRQFAIPYRYKNPDPSVARRINVNYLLQSGVQRDTGRAVTMTYQVGEEEGDGSRLVGPNGADYM